MIHISEIKSICPRIAMGGCSLKSEIMKTFYTLEAFTPLACLHIEYNEEVYDKCTVQCLYVEYSKLTQKR